MEKERAGCIICLVKTVVFEIYLLNLIKDYKAWENKELMEAEEAKTIRDQLN